MTIPKSSVLESELVSHIRQSANKGDSSAARAMAATVIVASDTLRAAEADAVIDRLMGIRPARVLHVRSGSEGPARAWTSARCSIDRASRGVCFEDIFIESPDDEAIDPRIWGPFLIRELPAILFWNFGPWTLSECGCGPYCAERVDLVIADGSVDFSRKGGKGEESVRNFTEAVLETTSSVHSYADLAWKRLENLRLAIARLFDGKTGQADSRRVETIEVSLRDPWSSLLTGGWLRSRFDAMGRKTEIRLAEGDPAVVFGLEGGSRSLVRFPSGTTAQLRFPDGTGAEMGFRDTDDGLILANLLDDPVADPMYRQALSKIGF